MTNDMNRITISESAQLIPDRIHKHEKRMRKAANELLSEPDDSSRATTTVVRELLSRFVLGKDLAISRAPQRAANAGIQELFNIRSLPLDLPGLRLEIEVVPVQGRGFSCRYQFRLEWLELEGARPLRENERIVSGLLSDDGRGISQSDSAAIDSLPTWRHDVPAQWDRWTDLLECLEDVARLKTLQLHVSVCDVDFEARSVSIALAASPASHERELLSSGDLVLAFGAEKGKLIEVPVMLGAAKQEDDLEITLYVEAGTAMPMLLEGMEVKLATRPDISVFQRQKHALDKLRYGAIQNPHLAVSLINPADARELPSAVWPQMIPIVGEERLRPAQRSAVEAALSPREITFIWGPPGTGKTEVIRAISESAIGAGLRVLVASQANAAVDNAVSRLKNLKGLRPVRLAQRDLHRTDESVKDVLDKVAVGSFLRRIEPLAELPENLAHTSRAVQSFLQDAPRDGQANEEQAINELWEPYRRSANLIGCTCAQASKLPERCPISGFDLVIIDEVSKATLVEMLPALILGTKVVLVGDHCQLPPVFRDDELSLRQTLEQSAGILDPDRLVAARELVDEPYFKNCKEQVQSMPYALATLNEQHRMHPHIREIIGPFYENRLEDAPNLTTQSRALPFGPHILKKQVSADSGTLWIDTGASHKEESCGTSRRNRGEAEVLVDLVHDLAKQVVKASTVSFLKLRVNRRDAGKLASDLLKPVASHKFAEGLQWTYWLDGHVVRPDTRCEANSMLVAGPALTVACITFYKAQKELLLSKMRDLSNEGELVGVNCRVDTVDSYQGSEAEFVVLSLVRTGFRPNSPFVTDFRRVNVAMSRAKRFLCILGCRSSFSEALVQLPHETDPTRVYRSILGNLQRRGAILRCA